MKTQQQIEDMKYVLSKEISEISDEMNSGILGETSWHEKRSIKLQKMAQYNILLEVLNELY